MIVPKSFRRHNMRASLAVRYYSVTTCYTNIPLEQIPAVVCASVCITCCWVVLLSKKATKAVEVSGAFCNISFVQGGKTRTGHG